jgi:hypothetical protein
MNLGLCDMKFKVKGKNFTLYEHRVYIIINEFHNLQRISIYPNS